MMEPEILEGQQIAISKENRAKCKYLFDFRSKEDGRR